MEGNQKKSDAEFQRSKDELAVGKKEKNGGPKSPPAAPKGDAVPLPEAVMKAVRDQSNGVIAGPPGSDSSSDEGKVELVLEKKRGLEIKRGIALLLVGKITPDSIGIARATSVQLPSLVEVSNSNSLRKLEAALKRGDVSEADYLRVRASRRGLIFTELDVQGLIGREGEFLVIPHPSNPNGVVTFLWEFTSEQPGGAERIRDQFNDVDLQKIESVFNYRNLIREIMQGTNLQKIAYLNRIVRDPETKGALSFSGSGDLLTYLAMYNWVCSGKTDVIWQRMVHPQLNRESDDWGAKFGAIGIGIKEKKDEDGMVVFQIVTVPPFRTLATSAKYLANLSKPPKERISLIEFAKDLQAAVKSWKGK